MGSRRDSQESFFVCSYTKCFRYGNHMSYLTKVIPVRLTSFAQGDCLPSIISIKLLHLQNPHIAINPPLMYNVSRIFKIYSVLSKLFYSLQRMVIWWKT